MTKNFERQGRLETFDWKMGDIVVIKYIRSILIVMLLGTRVW